MKLTAIVEVSIRIREEESTEEAQVRLIQEFVDTLDEWITQDGLPPVVKIQQEKELMDWKNELPN